MELIKVRKFLRDENNLFRVAFLQDTEKCFINGLTSVGDDGYVVHINPIDITVPVIIHECLHGIYPKKSEFQIEKESGHILVNMSRRQRKGLFFEWCCRIPK